jgi:hypothetical protein
MFGKPVLATPAVGGAQAGAVRRGTWSRVSPVGLSLLVAVLPKCSVCLMVHGSILAAMGLITIPQPPRAVVAGSLLLALGLLARSAHSRRRYGPVAVGAVAAALLLAELTHSHAGHVMHSGGGDAHSPLLTWVGSGLLVVASIWNAWPAGRPASPPSPRCAPCGGPSSRAAG